MTLNSCFPQSAPPRSCSINVLIGKNDYCELRCDLLYGATLIRPSDDVDFPVLLLRERKPEWNNDQSGFLFFYPRKSEGSVGYCTSSTRHEMARGAAIPRRINTYKRRGAASLNAGEGGFFAFPRPFSPQRRRRWIKELGEEGKKTHMDSDVKEQYSQIEWSLAGIYVTRYTRAVLKTDAPFN